MVTNTFNVPATAAPEPLLPEAEARMLISFSIFVEEMVTSWPLIISASSPNIARALLPVTITATVPPPATPEPPLPSAATEAETSNR